MIYQLKSNHKANQAEIIGVYPLVIEGLISCSVYVGPEQCVSAR